MGRPRKSLEQHLLHGTFNPTRHGARPKPAATQPTEISEAEQAARRAEIEAQRRAIYGEHPPDPGPRSGGSAKRIRW